MVIINYENRPVYSIIPTRAFTSISLKNTNEAYNDSSIFYYVNLIICVRVSIIGP